jgi:maltose O-acetyltransferase
MATGGNRSEKQTMVAGELYDASDPELQAEQRVAQGWLVRYCAALGSSATVRHVLLREPLAAIGQEAARVLLPP